MVHDRIDDASGATLLIGEARELTIGVVENVGRHVKKKSDQVQEQGPIKIQMARDDSKNAANESNRRRRELQAIKHLRDTKSDPAIKEKIDNSFELARFVGSGDTEMRRRSRFRNDAQVRSHFRRSVTPRERAYLVEC